MSKKAAFLGRPDGDFSPSPPNDSTDLQSAGTFSLTATLRHSPSDTGA